MNRRRTIEAKWGLYVIKSPNSARECKEAKKSPGIDGFNVEFYKFVWTDLRVLVH